MFHLNCRNNEREQVIENVHLYDVCGAQIYNQNIMSQLKIYWITQTLRGVLDSYGTGGSSLCLLWLKIDDFILWSYMWCLYSNSHVEQLWTFVNISVIVVRKHSSHTSESSRRTSESSHQQTRKWMWLSMVWYFERWSARIGETQGKLQQLGQICGTVTG